jgi:hypothetical protein
LADSTKNGYGLKYLTGLLTPPGITLDALSNRIRDLSNVISVMRYNDIVGYMF